mgnify:CR=1 FL=1
MEESRKILVALGVTNQAVSRWEANGGYPDIEMLPAIANYFHITMDELFGYESDRQTKLQSYLEQADQISNLNNQLSIRCLRIKPPLILANLSFDKHYIFFDTCFHNKRSDDILYSHTINMDSYICLYRV